MGGRGAVGITATFPESCRRHNQAEYNEQLFIGVQEVGTPRTLTYRSVLGNTNLHHKNMVQTWGQWMVAPLHLVVPLAQKGL